MSLATRNSANSFRANRNIRDLEAGSCRLVVRQNCHRNNLIASTSGLTQKAFAMCCGIHVVDLVQALSSSDDRNSESAKMRFYAPIGSQVRFNIGRVTHSGSGQPEPFESIMTFCDAG
jgi:hypothetical protein